MPKGRTYSFNFNWRGTLEPQFFYFPKYLMLAFGIKADAIVAVMPVKSESFLTAESCCIPMTILSDRPPGLR